MDVMTIHFATADELSDWNSKILSNPDKGNIFQGLEFAEQKKLGGWIPRFVVAEEAAITVLEKSVFGIGKLWYIPKGPGITRVKELETVISSLKLYAQDNGLFA